MAFIMASDSLVSNCLMTLIMPASVLMCMATRLSRAFTTLDQWLSSKKEYCAEQPLKKEAKTLMMHKLHSLLGGSLSFLLPSFLSTYRITFMQ